MYIKGKNRAVQPPLPTHPKKYHKPYRIRHFGLFLSGILVAIASVFGAGYLLGGSKDSPVPSISSGEVKSADSSLKKINSGIGFSLEYDNALLSANETNQEMSFRPRTMTVNGPEVLSELIITNSKSSSFIPKTDRDFTAEALSQTEEIVGSIKFQKAVYIQKPRFKTDASPIFSISWSGMADGKNIYIQAKNLPTSGDIPAVYRQIFQTLRFDDISSQVLAETIGTKDGFDVNRVSPAVVKIYHYVCGVLVINDTKQGQDACDGGAGSGFLISSDGYIATSGHVVSLEAADILVGQLLNNPAFLTEFTSAAGLTAQQRSRTDVVASVLAKIYDLPSQNLRIEDKREITFVSLGDRPLRSSTQEDIKQLFELPDSDHIKRAEITGLSYEPKDLLVIEHDAQQGFSASDVAVVKVNVSNAPFIKLADSARLQQNDPVLLVGFPADAENQLTSNNAIGPSVTNGTISSIRKAAGSTSLLFQTDADASEGSSGGPAIDQHGKAFGIVTYRFKGGSEANAAKSYLRDIDDLKELIDSKKLTLITNDSVQISWDKGLDLFNQEKYSKSITEFHTVLKDYPAHRLADRYIEQAQQAIRDGKDKKDPPYLLVGMITGSIAGLMIAIISVRLIIIHRHKHLAYKTTHLTRQKPIIPAV
ncbi:MAG TPA: trypsin-like peptidase domain-containing protein [Patescibacteria group bacterium]|nr:trypsin-like peptidase domain-containing protein [Patescibacteria group bacterium]